MMYSCIITVKVIIINISFDFLIIIYYLKQKLSKIIAFDTSQKKLNSNNSVITYCHNNTIFFLTYGYKNWLIMIFLLITFLWNLIKIDSGFVYVDEFLSRFIQTQILVTFNLSKVFSLDWIMSQTKVFYFMIGDI